MKRESSRLAVALISICGVAAVVFGCGDNRPPSTGELPLRALAVLYGKYVGAHGGQAPPNQEDFIKFITTAESATLKQFRIDDPNKLLISPRDGQPLKVVYGKPARGADSIIAYDSQPVDGVRTVVRSTGVVYEIDESEFQQVNPDK